MNALAEAAVALCGSFEPTASAGQRNEACYAAQNRYQSTHQASFFANSSSLLAAAGAGEPAAGRRELAAPTAAAASTAFLNIEEIFR